MCPKRPLTWKCSNLGRRRPDLPRQFEDTASRQWDWVEGAYYYLTSICLHRAHGCGVVWCSLPMRWFSRCCLLETLEVGQEQPGRESQLAAALLHLFLGRGVPDPHLPVALAGNRLVKCNHAPPKLPRFPSVFPQHVTHPNSANQNPYYGCDATLSGPPNREMSGRFALNGARPMVVAAVR